MTVKPVGPRTGLTFTELEDAYYDLVQELDEAEEKVRDTHGGPRMTPASDFDRLYLALLRQRQLMAAYCARGDREDREDQTPAWLADLEGILLGFATDSDEHAKTHPSDTRADADELRTLRITYSGTRTLYDGLLKRWNDLNLALVPLLSAIEDQPPLWDDDRAIRDAAAAVAHWVVPGETAQAPSRLYP